MIISILDQLKFPLRFSQTQVSSNQTVKCFRANNDDDKKKKNRVRDSDEYSTKNLRFDQSLPALPISLVNKELVN